MRHGTRSRARRRRARLPPRRRNLQHQDRRLQARPRRAAAQLRPNTRSTASYRPRTEIKATDNTGRQLRPNIPSHPPPLTFTRASTPLPGRRRKGNHLHRTSHHRARPQTSTATHSPLPPLQRRRRQRRRRSSFAREETRYSPRIALRNQHPTPGEGQGLRSRDPGARVSRSREAASLS